MATNKNGQWIFTIHQNKKEFSLIILVGFSVALCVNVIKEKSIEINQIGWILPNDFSQNKKIVLSIIFIFRPFKQFHSFRMFNGTKFAAELKTNPINVNGATHKSNAVDIQHRKHLDQHEGNALFKRNKNVAGVGRPNELCEYYVKHTKKQQKTSHISHFLRKHFCLNFE